MMLTTLVILNSIKMNAYKNTVIKVGARKVCFSRCLLITRNVIPHYASEILRKREYISQTVRVLALRKLNDLSRMANTRETQKCHSVFESEQLVYCVVLGSDSVCGDN